MPIGTCRLCLALGVELLNSHFVPAGIHRIVQADAPQAIQITGKIAMLSSHQARAHLLCERCELRFQQQGENWVIANCWRSPTDFPLLDALDRAAAFQNRVDSRAYAGRGISDVDVDQIVYFAASVFWRGAAHEWSTPKGKTYGAPPSRIHLGPYQEPLRLFLLGEATFPDGMYLSTWLEPKRDERENRHAVPPFKAFDTGYHVFRLFIPGVAFTLSVGRAVDREIQSTCTSRSGLLLVCPTEGLRNTEINRRVTESQARGKLASVLGPNR